MTAPAQPGERGQSKQWRVVVKYDNYEHIKPMGFLVQSQLYTTEAEAIAARTTIAEQAAEIERLERAMEMQAEAFVLAKNARAEAAEARAEQAERERDEAQKERNELRARRSGLGAFAREANFMCEHGVQARLDLVCRWCSEASLAALRERNAEMAAALEPFAEDAFDSMQEYMDGCEVATRVLDAHRKSEEAAKPGPADPDGAGTT